MYISYAFLTIHTIYIYIQLICLMENIYLSHMLFSTHKQSSDARWQYLRRLTASVLIVACNLHLVL